MTRVDFRELLEDNKPILFDGAVGTELYNRGVFINRSFEDSVFSQASLIKDIHLDYVRAGADVITTNSWAANSFKLKSFNIQDKTYDINFKAAQLAREIAGDEVYVAGSVGPLGVRIEPWGPTSFEEAKMAFRQQIDALLDGGVDLIILETFGDIGELQQAIEAFKDTRSKKVLIAQVTISDGSHLAMGTPVEFAMKQIEQWGADVVGFNCSVGPVPLMNAVKKVIDKISIPLIVQPNAGLPKEVDGRRIYMATPEYFGEYTKNFFQCGVRIVGGCCGTSPEHTKVMSKARRHQQAMRKSDAGERENEDVTTASELCAEDVQRIGMEKKSNWSAKIARGEKVTSIELVPPAGVKADKILERSKLICEAGVDAINIPDGPRASARMSAILTAVMIEQRVGIETVLHYTCRDRNLLGMQSDMMGAHSIGLRNMLIVTGDPPKMGSYPDATGVFDVDSIGLTNMVNRLNGGLDLGGRPIGEPTALSLGVGVNPVHQDFEFEMKRFKYKVEAGAEWAITQPVFDVKAMQKFLDYIEKENIRIPIIAGIWPLTSYRNAEFMNNEVPGVKIPDSIMQRMSKPTTPENSKKLGVEIAKEMIAALGDRIQGVQVSAPFGRIDLALEVLGM